MAGEIVTPKIFSCPGCGAALSVTAIGTTTTVVCSSCHAVSDAKSDILRVIGKFESAVVYYPYFELNSFGTLRGIKWKIIGFVVRRDKEYEFSWEEYLLYNPYNGYRWILRIDGHFSLTERLPVVPHRLDQSPDVPNNFDYEGRNFKLFNRGQAEVMFVAGEFYWRVSQGETVDMCDYISPPFILSEEVSKNESNYSISEYIPESEINSAFKRSEKGDQRGSRGVAANQPNPHTYSKLSFLTTLASLGALFAIYVFSTSVKKEKNVFQQSFEGRPYQYQAMPDASAPKNAISESFVIPDDIGNLELRMGSPVNNQWAEANVTLVNETTGEDFSVDEGVEYYSGVDSDGSWSEGSQTGSRIISSVPGGTYHLEAEVTGNMPEPRANIALVRNSGMGLNFLAAFLLIILPGVWCKWRDRAFEVSRWSNSDYNPYFSDDE